MRWISLAFVGVGAVGCGKHATEPAGSSGSGSAVAVGSDARPADAAIDAAKIATAVDSDCALSAPGVRCKLRPVGGTLPGEVCWRAIVAVIEADSLNAKMMVSEPACTHDVTGEVAVDLGFTKRTDPTNRCAAPSECRFRLARSDSATAAAATWKQELHDALVEEAHANDPASRADLDALVGAAIELDIDAQLRADPHLSRDQAKTNAANAGPSPGLEGTFTHGQVRCAIEATTQSAFDTCLHPPPSDAGVPPPQ